MHIGDVHQAACCSIANSIAAADAKVNTPSVTIRFRICERAVTLQVFPGASVPAGIVTDVAVRSKRRRPSIRCLPDGSNRRDDVIRAPSTDEWLSN